jgi:hypothetical protein
MKNYLLAIHYVHTGSIPLRLVFFHVRKRAPLAPLYGASLLFPKAHMMAASVDTS